MRVLRRDLEAAVQVLHAPIELAEVHTAEAQVVEEAGIYRDPGGGDPPGRCGPRRAGRPAWINLRACSN